MRLPKTVNILGRNFNVKYCDLGKEKDTESRGYIMHRKQQIYIENNECSRETQESTLLHEMLHAICNTCDIEIKEHDINLLETGLYQVLKDNKFLKED